MAASWCYFDVSILWIIVFVLSGIATPMSIMIVKDNFTSLDQTSLWPLYPMYLGNLIAGAFTPTFEKQALIDASMLFGFDVVGQAVCTFGLLQLGPPLFAIFYKSVTIFTALLAMCVLPPSSHPNGLQWAALVVVTVGLLVTGYHEVEEFGTKELFGGMCVVVGCFFYAGGAVASELVLGLGQRSMHPLQAAWVMGIEGTVACAIWSYFTFKMPTNKGTSDEDVAMSDEDVRFFWFMMGLLVVLNIAHQASWFTLVSAVGATTTAVLKAFQSACLFVAAGYFLCNRDLLGEPVDDEAQEICLTNERIVSFVIVSVGVVVYSFATRGPPDEVKMPLMSDKVPSSHATSYDGASRSSHA